MTFSLLPRALSDRPAPSRPGMTRASRSVPDGTGGEARKEQKGDRSSRQVHLPGRDETKEKETGPDSPSQDPATGPEARQGLQPKDSPARETGRVSREWLIRNALFVEYEDRNILGEIDSWPEPEGGFEVGLSREDILAAGRDRVIRDSWIAIEPEKHGIGGFCTRSCDDPGGNAR